MEEKRAAKGHKLSVSERNYGAVTGVSDVISFDDNEVLVQTDAGMLQIKGKELHIKNLNLERGEVELEGKIDSLIYTEVKNQNQSLLNRLFK